MERTIAALATPPGTGGLAVIRISGKKAFETISQCFTGNIPIDKADSHTILYGKIKDSDKLIDTVTVSKFVSPRSYTGEDVIEIGCHGGVLVSQEILDVLYAKGCLPAEAGEFTKRAFLNGKLDLTQVEAVADIIHAYSIQGTLTAARQLEGKFTLKISELRQKLLDTAGLLELELDFAEEELEFVGKDEINSRIQTTKDYCITLASSFRSSEILRSGYFIGIAGYPNSGKSTLFNRLLDKNRAIVSHIPGTTRDYIEEDLFIDGLGVKITDTAGIRDSEDIIEIEGIKLVDSVLKQSNMILVINDIDESKDNSNKLYERIMIDYPNADVVLLQNKIDLCDSFIEEKDVLYLSAKYDKGIDKIKDIIAIESKNSTERVKDILLNKRHADLLNIAIDDLSTAQQSLELDFENEIVAIDIRKSAKTLSEITGDSWDEEVLNNIFSRFCIGK